jgi:hypothetical protein
VRLDPRDRPRPRAASTSWRNDEVEEDVGAGPDEHVLRLPALAVSVRRGSTTHTFAATRLDVAQVPRAVGHLEEAPLRDHRVRADHDEALRATHVGERQREGEAVEQARDGELVRAVLRGRREHAARAQARHEALREDRMQRGEARRRADVHRDRVGAVIGADAPHLLADLGERVVPVDRHVTLPRALLRMTKPIGRGVEVVLLEPLEAGEAARRDVRRVGPHLEDAVALDVDLEPAERLTDTAEGVLGLHAPAVARSRRAVQSRGSDLGYGSSGSRASTWKLSPAKRKHASLSESDVS